mgnify:CR=1 FL=1
MRLAGPLANPVGEAFAQTTQCWAGIHFVEHDIENREFSLICQGLGEGVVELAFGADQKAFATVEECGQFVELPFLDIVEFAFEYEALGQVAVVVKDDDDRVEAHSDGGGEFGAGEVESTVTDQYQWTQAWQGNLGANCSNWWFTVWPLVRCALWQALFQSTRLKIFQ